jgi:hypothetical protein
MKQESRAMYESGKPKRKRKLLAPKETQALMILGLLMLMVMMTGIGFLAGILYSNSTKQTAVSVTSLTTPTRFPSVQETATALANYLTANSATATPRSMCGWAWHTEVNSELSAEIQETLNERLPDYVTVEVRAKSFGETCSDNDDTVRGFGVMETDFHVIVSIENLPADDAESIRQMIAPVLREILLVLNEYPPDTTPGPMAGLIEIEFTGQKAVGRLRSGYDFVIETLRQGLTGDDLLAALSMIE